jgi:hypothetical protein
MADSGAVFANLIGNEGGFLTPAWMEGGKLIRKVDGARGSVVNQEKPSGERAALSPNTF